jgi:hypothetical protein
MMENGWVLRERKKNNELVMPILVSVGEGRLKQNLRQMDSS